jgi:hypothetical protein
MAINATMTVALFCRRILKKEELLEARDDSDLSQNSNARALLTMSLGAFLRSLKLDR